MTRGDRTPPGAALSRIISHRPLAAGSLIVTLYGDFIVPRGGVLGLATITQLLAAVGLNGGQIRTALSRLVADGWFERRRDGRTSSFQLSGDKAAEFEQAARRIYSACDVPNERVLDQAVLVEPDADRRQVLKAALQAEGFGPISAAVLIRPRHDRQPVLPSVPGVVRGTLTIDDPTAADLALLVRSAFPLDAILEACNELIENFAAVARRPPGDPEAAFVTRLLLIHQYRRIVLKDPLLPRFMLPKDWAGYLARDLVAGLYRAILPASEAWLTAVAAGEGDTLPEAGDALARRFA